MLKAANKAFVQAKFCEKFGMPLTDYDIYKQVTKDAARYYSTKLSLTLKNRALNKRLQKRAVLKPVPYNSARMCV